MASRKSMMHPRVEELGGITPSVSSPLRRKSIIAHKTAPKRLEVNDDEAERENRRAVNATSPVAQTSDRRRSLGLSFIAQMSNPQIAEKVQQCIQLNTENKITIKNAFSLQMIDYMTYMIKKQDPDMNNLQVASTSLDVSTKIYGLRIDNVYTEVLKMSGGLDKQDKNDDRRENEAVDENGDPTGESEAENQAREQAKKKRKSKKKIILSSEELRGPIETVNPSSLSMCTDDTQTTDMLYVATIPYHANRGLDLHLNNDVVLDTVDPNEKGNLQIINVPGIDDLQKCEMSSLAYFNILDWSVEDEPEEPSSIEDAPVENGFQFDLDASLPADGEPSNVGMNYFDIEEDEDVDRCARGAQPPVNIVDFREILQTAPHNEISEYSYIQANMDIQWAGASHWKIRHPAKNLAGSRIVGRCDQEPIKRKKELNLLFNDQADAVEHVKFEKSGGNRIKLNARTTKNIWTEEKIIIPECMRYKYDVSQTCKYYLLDKVKNFPKNFDMNASHIPEETENYDYDNENDRTDYCPNVESEDQPEVPEGGSNNGADFEENVGVCTQAFMGDNLVELPKMTNEVILPFSQRAKKIDMRQLKKCIWKNLIKTGTGDKENVDARGQPEGENREKVNGTVLFSNIFKELPKTLSKNNIDALSLPIAFISLLHLANEKTLQIDPNDESSDLYIQQA